MREQKTAWRNGFCHAVFLNHRKGLRGALNGFGNLIQEAFRFLPAQAGVGDGLAIAMLADLLASWLDITLDHHAFYEIMDIRRVPAAVQDFLNDTDLFPVLLVGI